MKATLWFRIGAIVMLLFGILHTIGFLTFRPPSANGMAVWNAMNDVSFTVDGGTYSYGHFYTAFGLSITVAQLFGAWVAWTLGSMARRGAAGVHSIAWAFVLWQIVGIVLAILYISAKPAITAGLAAACMLIGVLLVPKDTKTQEAS